MDFFVLGKVSFPKVGSILDLMEKRKYYQKIKERKPFWLPVSNEEFIKNLKQEKTFSHWELLKELCPCQVGDKFICLRSHFTIIWIIYGLYGNIYCHWASLTNPTRTFYSKQASTLQGNCWNVWVWVCSSWLLICKCFLYVAAQLVIWNSIFLSKYSKLLQLEVLEGLLLCRYENINYC